MIEALREVARAINDPGSHPEYHYRIMERSIDEWPTLWRALMKTFKDQDDPEFKKAYEGIRLAWPLALPY